MPKNIYNRFVAFAILAFLWSAVLGADTSERIIELPTYPISGDSPWLISEIDGYVVISLADEKTTRRFATLLRDSAALTSHFCPETLVDSAPAPRDVVLLEHMDVDVVTPNAPLRRGWYYTQLGFSLGDQSLTLLTTKGQKQMLDKKNALEISLGRCFRLARPTLPMWAADGRHHSCIYRSIHNKGDMALERPRISTKELQPLADALTYAPLFFPENRTLLYTRQVFALWAWTADGGRMKARWESLAAAAACEPFTEAMFREHMGMSLKEADAELVKYLEGKSWKETTTTVLPNSARPAAAVKVRRATGQEVRRYVGAAYLGFAKPTLITDASRAAYLRKAVETLASGKNDQGDGEIQASLGLALLRLGERPGARLAFTRAIDAKTTRPLAYVFLAELTLDGDGSEKTVTVSPEVASQALELIRHAWALKPEVVHAYRVAVRACQVLGASDPQKVKDSLPDLARGVRLFPRDAALAGEVIALHRLHGELRQAEELSALALAWSPDSRALFAPSAMP